MTPTLKAMVEAMAAEFQRQADADSVYAFFNPDEGDAAFVVGKDGGQFDLEKVARAGLKAIQTPGESTIAAGAPMTGAHHGPCEPMECAEDTFRAMIDAILQDGR